MFFKVRISHLNARRRTKIFVQALNQKSIRRATRVFVWTRKHYFSSDLKAPVPTRHDSILLMRCWMHRKLSFLRKLRFASLTVLRTVSMFLTKHWLDHEASLRDLG